MNKLILVLLVGSWIVLPSVGHSNVLPLSGSIVIEALSEAVPTAWAPEDFSVEDFEIQWEHAPGGEMSSGSEEIRISFEKGSLEWVRVNEVLRLPRARIRVEVQNLASGGVAHAGFFYPFAVRPDHKAALLVPVALLAGAQNPIEVVVQRQGHEWRGRAQIRFKPRGVIKARDRVYLDAGCSRYGVSVSSAGADQDDWVYVGCRLVQTRDEHYRTSTLELYVLWDGVGQSIEVAGSKLAAASASVFAIRMSSEPGSVRLKGGQRELRLKYFIPEKFRRGAIGLGLGPYAFRFRSDTEERTSWIMLPTLYVSYALTEKSRFVVFDATTLNRYFITDLGIYFNNESFKALDRRLTMNLMLGMHFTGFKYGSQYYFKIGAPQGVEFIFSDFLRRGYNATFGGFIYPGISGKSYYNTWIRYGSAQLFGEVNYISWEEQIDKRNFSSKSVGVSIGFPVPFLRFL